MLRADNFVLQRTGLLAICSQTKAMSAEEEVIELAPDAVQEDSVDQATPMRRWARTMLLVLTAPWLAVFVVATQLAVFALGVVPIVIFFVAGQRAVGRSGLALLGDVGAALILGAGISVNNSRAVLEGLGPRIGEWHRTPKTTASRKSWHHSLRKAS